MSSQNASKQTAESGSPGASPTRYKRPYVSTSFVLNGMDSFGLIKNPTFNGNYANRNMKSVNAVRTMGEAAREG